MNFAFVIFSQPLSRNGTGEALQSRSNAAATTTNDGDNGEDDDSQTMTWMHKIPIVEFRFVLPDWELCETAKRQTNDCKMNCLAFGRQWWFVNLDKWQCVPSTVPDNLPIIHGRRLATAGLLRVWKTQKTKDAERERVREREKSQSENTRIYSKSMFRHEDKQIWSCV